MQDTRLTTAAFRALIDDGACDAVIGFYSTVPSNEVFADRLCEAMVAGVAGHADPLLVICMVAGPDTVARYEAGGALVFEDPDRAVRAIAALNHFAKAFAAGNDPAPSLARAEPLEARVYSEAEAKQLLAAAGVPVLTEVLVGSPEEAAAAAERIGLPVAMKVVSRDVMHKSDCGGVALGIADIPACREAYDLILASVRRAHPDAAIDGVLVSPMAEPGIELIVGARFDPPFGPVVVVGLGGVFVEVLRDVAVRLAPVDQPTARAMLEQLAGSQLLRGARGRPPIDSHAVERCVVAVSRFAASHGADLREVEVNPLVAYPDGRGAVALDAVLVGGDKERTA